MCQGVIHSDGLCAPAKMNKAPAPVSSVSWKSKSNGRHSDNFSSHHIAVIEPSSLWHSNSATGTRTRVARVRAEYPSQLDYSGSCCVPRRDAMWRLLWPNGDGQAHACVPLSFLEEEEQGSKLRQGLFPRTLLSLRLVPLAQQFRHRDSNPARSGEGQVS